MYMSEIIAILENEATGVPQLPSETEPSRHVPDTQESSWASSSRTENSP